MIIYPCPIDFAQAWHDCTAQSPSHRGPAEVDLAYWDAHATGYDADSRGASAFEGQLAALEAIVRPTDTLLDVGAGTGRFAVPLARQVRSVTALDHSAAMLKVLRDRLEAERATNVIVVEEPWESANTPALAEQFDVVLAAWSLYRMPDILTAINKLVAATRRTLVILGSAGNSIRHDTLQRQIWGHLDSNNTPLNIYFHGVLWQAGYLAEMRLIQELKWLQGESPLAIAQQLSPELATTEETNRYAELLEPHLVIKDAGYSYCKTEVVSMICWNRSL